MCIFISSLDLLLDCKTIFITFLWRTLSMLIGVEAIGIVVELGFTALQHNLSHMECS